jgi:hypothetical protein
MALIVALLPATAAHGARGHGPHCGGERATLDATVDALKLFGFARRDNVIVGRPRDEKLRGGRGESPGRARRRAARLPASTITGASETRHAERPASAISVWVTNPKSGSPSRPPLTGQP